MSERPTILAPNLDGIPADLRDRPQWVLWRLEELDGRWTKVPYQARHPERHASSTKPATWATFEEAWGAREQADGIGYVFSADDPFVGLDLDDLPEADKGAIMLALESYAERSVTKVDGYHVLIRAQLNGRGRHPADFGVFSEGRFFVVTGAHVVGTPETIEGRQAELDDVLARFLPTEPERPAVARRVVPLNLDDEELLRRARAAKDGGKFDALSRGDWSGYPSQSEADLALCSKLAFWTGRDAPRMDNLFRRSGLMRAKWDERRAESTYGGETITKAIEGCTEVYEPRPEPPIVQRAREAAATRPDEAAEAEESAWRPLPLPQAAAKAGESPRPEHGLGFSYGRGNITLLSAEPGTGKSMVSGIFTAEEVRAGRDTLYIDFERTAVMLNERLEAMGLSAEERSRVHYLRPQLRAEPEEIGAMVTELAPSLIILDAYDAALASFGFETKNEDVRRFNAAVLEPLRSSDAAIVVPDHVTKNPDQRGRYSIGGQSKLAIVEAHIGISVISPLRRNTGGKLKLRTLKDSHGWLPLGGVLHVSVTEGRMSWTVTLDDGGDSEDGFRPTGLMEKVSRALEIAGKPLSRNELKKAVKGKGTYVRQAIDALIREGYAEEIQGPHNARLVKLVRKFREDDQDDDE